MHASSSSLLFAVLLIIAFFGVTAHADDLAPAPPQQPRFCPRRFEIEVTPDHFDFTATGATMCNTDNGLTPQGKFVAGAIRHKISSRHMPQFSLQSFRKHNDLNNGKVFGAAWGIDQVIEYRETNGVQGFQDGPQGDQIVRRYELKDDAPRYDNAPATWTPLDIKQNNLTLPDGNKVSLFDVGMRLPKVNETYIAEAAFRILFSSAELKVRAPNSTENVAIVPSGTKTTFLLRNITMSQQDTRLAVGLHLLTPGTIRNNTDAGSQLPPPPTQDANTPPAPTQAVEGKQDVLACDGQDNQARGGAFAWQPFAHVRFANGTDGKVPLIFSNKNNCKDPQPGLVDGPQGFTIRRLYFSLDDRITDLVWDPSIAAGEDTASITTNGSASLQASGIVAMVVLLVTLLLTVF